MFSHWNKPRTLWCAFFLCFALVFSSLAWVSDTVIRLENSKKLASHNATRERNSRLALYRVENASAALIAQENNHPYFHYIAFHAPGRAYEALLQPPDSGAALVPSPFLTSADPLVRLHFQVTPDGTVTSPEAPEDELLDQARYRGPLSSKASRLHVLRASFTDPAVFAAAALRARENARLRNSSPPAYEQDSPFSDTDEEVKKSVDERNERLQIFGAASGPGTADAVAPAASPFGPAPRAEHRSVGKTAPLRVTEDPTPLYPIWLDNELFLLRTLATNHGTVVQGVWLDWPGLKNQLTQRIADLLPGVTFRPAPPQPAAGARVRNALATLPISLLNTAQPAPAPATPFSAERVTLFACWTFAGLAFVGLGLLLHGAVSLSERRGTFVSAVTHELRTPLTTFQLYTEMLSSGMVPPESQKTYLATLHAEAARLTHLVENVLGFARLEKGRALRRDETLTVRELSDASAARLRDRLESARMKLAVDAASDALEIPLRTDGTAVEQILFNLADNAAKYASSTGDTATLRVHADTGAVHFEFADNGPGIPASARKKLFKAFNRSAEDAAGSKPGVGLGLAFSRQLARRLGGDLRLLRSDGTGCAFRLSLPRSTGHPA